MNHKFKLLATTKEFLKGIKNNFLRTTFTIKKCLLFTLIPFLSLCGLTVLFGAVYSTSKSEYRHEASGVLALDNNSFTARKRRQVLSLFDDGPHASDIYNKIAQYCEKNSIKTNKGSIFSPSEIKSSFYVCYHNRCDVLISFHSFNSNVSLEVLSYALIIGKQYSDIFVEDSLVSIDSDTKINEYFYFPVIGLASFIAVGVLFSFTICLIIPSISKRYLLVNKHECVVIDSSFNIRQRIITLNLESCRDKTIVLSDSFNSFLKKNNISLRYIEEPNYAETRNLLLVVMDGVSLKKEINDAKKEFVEIACLESFPLPLCIFVKR